jgi:sn-glycerol 3-phosphate transport system permease protein
LYMLIALLGNFLLPVGLAMLTLQVGRRYTDLYQSLLFTPTMVAVSVGSLLWQWIYLPTGGLLNTLLSVFGLPEVNWLNNPDTALGAVGVVAAWQFMGFNYLISLAGLMAIPREYLEAARIDGATGWPLLRSVIIPLLMPTLLFVALTSILQSLPNAFVPIEILTRGGPSESSDNLLYTIYQDGFHFFQVGKASAEAVVTILLLGGAAIWQFRILDRSLSYER